MRKADTFSRRIGKTLRHTKGGATITRSWSYVYDNDDIILEEMTDGSGTVKTYFTHGQNVDEHLGMERNGQFSYYHADALGSIVALTDPRQQVVQRYGYFSFGAVSASGDSIENRYTFTGREFDKETGLYFNRARFYDPIEGRFTSKDPIGFAGGDINIYAYSSSSPANFTDSHGLSAEALPLPLPLEFTCRLVRINPFILGASLATVPTSTSTCADYPPQNGCMPKKCKPCIPPVGTIATAVHLVPPKKPHFPRSGNHVHWFRMNQSPYPECRCFWDRNFVAPTEGSSAPAGTVPVTPAAGGGPM